MNDKSKPSQTNGIRSKVVTFLVTPDDTMTRAADPELRRKNCERSHGAVKVPFNNDHHVAKHFCVPEAQRLDGSSTNNMLHSGGHVTVLAGLTQSPRQCVSQRAA